MTTLPNLSTWHPVPLGATIPADTPYAYAYGDGLTVELGGYPSAITVDDNSYYTHYTESPIGPPLPTEEGATILVSNDERPPFVLLMREAGRWVNSHGVEWYNNEIHAWAPVTVGETVAVRP